MGWTGHGEDMGRKFFCEKNDFVCVLIINKLQVSGDFFEKKWGGDYPGWAVRLL